jgi:hypothetical protein
MPTSHSRMSVLSVQFSIPAFISQSLRLSESVGKRNRREPFIQLFRQFGAQQGAILPQFTLIRLNMLLFTSAAGSHHFGSLMTVDYEQHLRRPISSNRNNRLDPQ